MRRSTLLALLAIAGAGLALGAGPGSAKPIPYKAPPETAKLAPGPNLDSAEGYCAACHSVDYITTQPRSVGAGFWQAEVTKMIKAYGAPIPDEDAKKIVDYLNATYRKAP
jgi:hypothetical protein